MASILTAFKQQQQEKSKVTPPQALASVRALKSLERWIQEVPCPVFTVVFFYDAVQSLRAVALHVFLQSGRDKAEEGDGNQQPYAQTGGQYHEGVTRILKHLGPRQELCPNLSHELEKKIGISF